MITVKVFLNGKMIKQTESNYAVVFTGDIRDKDTVSDGIGVYGELSVEMLGTTLCSGTIECVDAVCREIGMCSLDRLHIINAISDAIRQGGSERILQKRRGRR